MLVLFYALIAGAIAFMIAGLIMAIRLRVTAPGGSIGKVVRLLIAFIVLFMLGYLAAPFMPYLPAQAGLILVGVIFFFGAVYVVLVLWLIGNLVRKVMDELRLNS
jgi:hypothetical protein